MNPLKTYFSHRCKWYIVIYWTVLPWRVTNLHRKFALFKLHQVKIILKTCRSLLLKTKSFKNENSVDFFCIKTVYNKEQWLFRFNRKVNEWWCSISQRWYLMASHRAKAPLCIRYKKKEKLNKCENLCVCSWNCVKCENQFAILCKIVRPNKSGIFHNLSVRREQWRLRSIFYYRVESMKANTLCIVSIS